MTNPLIERASGVENLTPEQRADAARMIDQNPQLSEEQRAAARELLQQLDAPLDVVENAPPYIFSPGAARGISSLDITEIALTFVLQLVGGQISGPPGQLRRLAMRADFHETMSPEAQRFMIQQQPAKEAQNNG